MKVCFLLVVLVVGLVQGKWVPARISLTADNAYAVYAGDSEGLVYLGSKWANNEREIFDTVEFYPAGPLGKTDPTPPKGGLYLDTDQAIYVVAWSDAADNQGILTNVVINGVQISPDNEMWQVYPTGIFPKPDSSYPPAMPGCNPSAVPFDRDVAFGADATAPPCRTWVQEMIALADSQNAWKTPTRGSANNEDSHYGRAVSKLPHASKWMWYESAACGPSMNSPFDSPKKERCQHREPLIFKIPTTAVAADPTACTQTDNGHYKYCAGQCPFRPDGSAPRCASIFTPDGGLTGCECCGQCTVVSFDNPLLNYCTGYCENNLCLDCLVSAWGTLPNGQQFVKDCKCQPTGHTDICSIDRCNNICVGGCPNSPNVRCTPVYSSSNQLIDCYCPNITTPCQVSATGTTCVGQCNTAGNPCKGVYDGGNLKECTCDCCDLLRDPVDPRNNRCIGKCDKITTEKCQASATTPVVIDGQIYNIIVGCDCF